MCPAKLTLPSGKEKVLDCGEKIEILADELHTGSITLTGNEQGFVLFDKPTFTIENNRRLYVNGLLAEPISTEEARRIKSNT